jgi:hypothetical protein
MESNLYIILLSTHTYHQQTTQHRQGLLRHRGHAPNNAPQGTVLHDPGIMEKQEQVPTRESRLTHTNARAHTHTHAHTEGGEKDGDAGGREEPLLALEM